MHNHLLWGGDDQRLPEEALLSLALEAWLFSILPETDSRFSLFFPEPRFLTSLPTQRPGVPSCNSELVFFWGLSLCD